MTTLSRAAAGAAWPVCRPRSGAQRRSAIRLQRCSREARSACHHVHDVGRSSEVSSRPDTVRALGARAHPQQVYLVRGVKVQRHAEFTRTRSEGCLDDYFCRYGDKGCSHHPTTVLGRETLVRDTRSEASCRSGAAAGRQRQGLVFDDPSLHSSRFELDQSQPT